MVIHNIFSKEKIPKDTLQPITIDHREKNSLVVSRLIELGCKPIFEQLPVADYLVNGVAIERKTINDLKTSIINKRIFAQLKELSQYPNHLLLIEGIMDQYLYAGGVHGNAIRGFLLSVALEFKTPIIYTHNERDTALYLHVLAKKEKNKDVAIRASKIALSKEEQKQFILEGFPGIGPKAAKKLIEQFQTLENIFSAKEKELEDVLGIRAKEFRDLLT